MTEPTHDNPRYVELARDTYRLLDRLYVEALNGVVCTPPSTGGDPFDDSTPWRPVDVDAPTNRVWCASCQSIWRELMQLRAECGAALGYREFRAAATTMESGSVCQCTHPLPRTDDKGRCWKCNCRMVVRPS